jgi:putative Mg2+ transporter-C (MgtC) family protein
MELAAQLEVLGTSALAALCGAAVGLERERSGKAAGLRTHMLVASASAMATGIGAQLVAASGGDPTRVLHAVITGVGFIGSGVIFRDARQQSGLTSSAVIMVTSMIGAACGLGAPVVACGATLLAVSTLWHGKRVGITVSDRWVEPATSRHTRRRFERDRRRHERWLERTPAPASRRTPAPRPCADDVTVVLRDDAELDLRPNPRPRPRVGAGRIDA